MGHDESNSCRWPRCSSYEIVENTFGQTVQPTPGAKLKWYYPAEHFGALSRALTELVAMLRKPLNQMEKSMLAEPLRPIEEWAPRLGARTCEQLVLEWLPEYGLLGILLERLKVVRDRAAPYERGALQQHLCSRIGHDWVSRDLLPLMPEQTRPPGAEMLLEADLGRDFELTQVAFTNPEWLRFFPAVAASGDDPENYPYGSPDSESFWRAYGEPIPRLLYELLRIDRAQRALNPSEKAGRWRSSTGVYEMHAFHRTELNRLGSQVSQALVATGRREQTVGWAYASLLGLLASSAIWAMSRQGVKACKRCGTTFVSGRSDAKYCCDRCKKAAYQERVRHPEGADDV
jgi:hypothetical protein